MRGEEMDGEEQLDYRLPRQIVCAEEPKEDIDEK